MRGKDGSMEQDERTTLGLEIQQSLARADRRVGRLQVVHTLLSILAVLAGALSTLLAGGSAVNQAPLLGIGEAGWGLTCGFAALLTLTGTVAGGINQQFRIGETLGQARSCAGRLSALEVSLSMGNVQTAKIAEKYADVVGEFQAVLR